MQSTIKSLSENRLRKGDSPNLLRRLRKFGTVPDGFRIGSKRALHVAVVVLCTAGGCGSGSTFEFDALDLAPPQEELSEFPLGRYSIPIPVAADQVGARSGHDRFQMDFELYALVRPEHKSSISDDWARHEGRIRDDVIRVFRNASVDELQEPELATLKARLMDVLALQVGEKDVRQLLITEVVSQRL